MEVSISSSLYYNKTFFKTTHNIQVYDGTAHVIIYIVTTEHTIMFIFENSANDVETKQSTVSSLS